MLRLRKEPASAKTPQAEPESEGREQLRKLMDSYLSEEPEEIAQFIVDHIEVCSWIMTFGFLVISLFALYSGCEC